MKNPKQAPVLCVQRQALPEHLRISHTALVPMHINDLEYKQVSFINRAVVDANVIQTQHTLALALCSLRSFHMLYWLMMAMYLCTTVKAMKHAYTVKPVSVLVGISMLKIASAITTMVNLS